MGIRLQPFSSAWLAPAALAARLRAETGAAEGQGIASLGAGLAQGVGQHVANVHRQEDIARSESHYADLQARLSKQDELEDVKTRLSIAGQYARGLNDKLNAAVQDGDETTAAALKQKLADIASTGGSLTDWAGRLMKALSTPDVGTGEMAPSAIPGATSITTSAPPNPALNAQASHTFDYGTSGTLPPDSTTSAGPAAPVSAVSPRDAAIDRLTRAKAGMSEIDKAEARIKSVGGAESVRRAGQRRAQRAAYEAEALKAGADLKTIEDTEKGARDVEEARQKAQIKTDPMAQSAYLAGMKGEPWLSQENIGDYRSGQIKRAENDAAVEKYAKTTGAMSEKRHEWSVASVEQRQAFLTKMEQERAAAAMERNSADNASREKIAAARSAEKSVDAQDRRAKAVVDEFAKDENQAEVRYKTLKELAAKGSIDAGDDDLAKSFDVWEKARVAHSKALSEYAHPSSPPDVDRAKHEATDEFEALKPEKQTKEAWEAIKKRRGL